MIDFSVSNILILLSIGLVAGALSGFFGIGGGVIIIPSLIIFMGLSQHQAQATSLGTLLIPVTLPAFLRYYKKEKGGIRIKDILWMILGVIIGGYCGAKLAVWLDAGVLKKIFALLLLYMGIKQFWKKKKIVQENVSPAETKVRPKNIFLFILIGMATGLCSGLMGIGGGVVSIPILMMIGFSQHQAQGISLGQLSIPIGAIFAFMVYKNSGHMDFDIFTILSIAIGFVIASLISAKAVVSMPANTLKKYFSIFILCMGLYFLFKH